MEKLFDKLTNDEKYNIEKYIRTYASYEEGNYYEGSIDLQYILRYWDRNKLGLYNLFDGNFILEKQVEFMESINEIRRKVSKVLQDSCGWDFRQHILSCAEDAYYNGDLKIEFKEFINCSQDWWFTRATLDYLFDRDDLANCNFSKNTFHILYKDKKITVQKGCRPIKILGKLAKLFNLGDEFEKFSTAISVTTNQKKVKGTLCLSIHPLDFMTMSDNDSKWSSCMSWKEIGCYRRGTVEMMNSKNVVVAYLKSENDMDLFEDGNAYWNNKKWRSLFIVDDRAIVSIKAYPYQNYILSEMVLNWLRELKTGYNYCDFMDEIPYHKTFSFMGKQLYFDTDTEAMYNDFGCDVKHMGYINTDIVKSASGEDRVRLDINYSGESICMACGEEKCFNSEGDLFCMDCEHVATCKECGEYIYCEDDEYWLDDRLLCYNCYEERARVDDITEETHDENNMYTVRLVDDALEVYMRETNFENRCWGNLPTIHTYYSNVESSYYTNMYFGGKENIITPHEWSDYRFVNIKNLTEDGIELYKSVTGNSLEEMYDNIKYVYDNR